MRRKVDNVGALALPRPMQSGTFDSVGDGLKEHFRGHRSRKTERRIGNVKETIPVGKLVGMLADKRGRRLTHILVPHLLKTTERFGNINGARFRVNEQNSLVTEIPSFSARRSTAWLARSCRPNAAGQSLDCAEL